MQMFNGEKVVLSARVEEWCADYLALAAAKLSENKGQVLSDALRLHREFLIRTGVLREDER